MRVSSSSPSSSFLFFRSVTLSVVLQYRNPLLPCFVHLVVPFSKRGVAACVHLSGSFSWKWQFRWQCEIPSLHIIVSPLSSYSVRSVFGVIWVVMVPLHCTLSSTSLYPARTQITGTQHVLRSHPSSGFCLSHLKEKKNMLLNLSTKVVQLFLTPWFSLLLWILASTDSLRPSSVLSILLCHHSLPFNNLPYT